MRAFLLLPLLLLSGAGGLAQTPSDTMRLDGRDGVTLKGLVLTGEASPSLLLNRCRHVRIVDCDLRSIRLEECESVVIEKCRIHDAKEVGIQLYRCKGVEVRDCRLENVASGVYAIQGSGIVVTGCRGRNMKGPYPRGQLVQFDNVMGPGNRIARNECLNEFKKSHHEDAINIYQSEGTADSPIVVEGNRLLGDPVRGSEGMSASGSGIMLGDCGGKNIVCRGNTVIDGGQVGIGVAGGENIVVEGNTIVGRFSNVSNVGLYAWNQSKKPGANIRIRNNRVNWVEKHGESHGWWDGGGFANLDVSGNDFADAALLRSVPPLPKR